MSKGRDGLHLDGVSLVKRVIQNTWRVDDLPTRVLVIGVTNKQVLGRESPRLHIDVGFRDVVDEAGLADVGEAGNDECATVSVNGWESAQMLAHLLEITQARLELLDEGAGATECGSLQLLRAIERVSVLEQAHVIVRNAVTNRLGLVDVTEGQLVMITVVEDVHEIRVERVDIVQLGETIDNCGKFLTDCLLHELDLTHVKLADAVDFETLADLRGRLALRLGQHDIDEVVCLGDLDDGFEVVCTSHQKGGSSQIKQKLLIMTLPNRSDGVLGFWGFGVLGLGFRV